MDEILKLLKEALELMQDKQKELDKQLSDTHLLAEQLKMVDLQQKEKEQDLVKREAKVKEVEDVVVLHKEALEAQKKAAGLDSEIDTFADGSAPDGFTDCTNEATEIGSTGQYYLSVTQAEMNVDYSIIQIKSSSTGAVTQTMLIRTMVGDPLLLATTDDGGTLNVTGGALDTVTTATTATNLTNAPSDSSGVTTLLSRLSSTRAGYLDNLNGLTTSGIVDATWDELIAGHLGAGSTGSALNAAGSAGDPWATAYPGAYGSGTFGKALKQIKDNADLIPSK